MMKDFDFEQRDYEKAGELEAVVWAEENGWVVRKFKYEGRRGAMDRIFFGHGHIVLIEMKRKDGRLRKEQKDEIDLIRATGVRSVHVCYSRDEAIAVLKSYML